MSATGAPSSSVSWPLDAVHVHVDEPGHDVTSARVDDRARRPGPPRAGGSTAAIAVAVDRATRCHRSTHRGPASDHVAAGDARSRVVARPGPPAQSTCTCSLRPSSGKRRASASPAPRSSSRSTRRQDAAAARPRRGAVSTSTPPLSAGGKRAIVQVVAIERDQRAAQLPREAEVLAIGGAAQIVVLHHEQHVPLQLGAHGGTRRAGTLAST